MLAPKHAGPFLNSLFVQFCYLIAGSRFKPVGDYPKVIYLELTSVCNLRCPMCPHTFMERKASSITMPLVEKFADEIAQYYPQLETLGLHGFGEAIYHPQLAEVLQLLHHKLPSTLLSVSMNLAGAAPKHIDALFDNGIGEIGCWIDGTTQDTYAKQRKGGQFEKTLDILEYLLERKRKNPSPFPYFHIGMVMTKLNDGELEEFVQYWKERLRGIPGVGIRSVVGHTFNGKIDDAVILRPKKEWFFYLPCTSPFRRVLILSNGDICLCCYDSEGESKVGNLSQTKLREAWRSPRAELLRAQMYRADYRLNMCRGCDAIRFYPLDGRPKKHKEYLSYQESCQS